jgi:hypothetical protein
MHNSFPLSMSFKLTRPSLAIATAATSMHTNNQVYVATAIAIFATIAMFVH